MFVISRLQRVVPPLILSPGGWRCLSCLLEARPASSLLDLQLTVAGSGLEPGAVVRLDTRLEEPGQTWDFQSVCLYQTDSSGAFSTASQPPLSGSHYEGIHR